MTCIYCTSLLPWPSFMASTSQVHFPSHVPLPFPFDNTNPIIQSLHMSKFQNVPTLAPILLTNVYFLRDATNIAIKTMRTTIVAKVGWSPIHHIIHVKSNSNWSIIPSPIKETYHILQEIIKATFFTVLTILPIISYHKHFNHDLK
jgi:hypothetical protein